MSTYNVVYEEGVLKVEFGEPSQNNQIVQDAEKACEMLPKEQLYGKVLKVNGPASMPVAFTIAHAFSHLVPAIAVYDPKLGGYVVAITHSPDYKVGDVIQ